ncbi:L-type lectin-domain containing receptor kinase IX.1-like, partial [Trifolium medium]|nr:L-type lectin-domain containing receptor kinase IX.1-like [Trifolium medium]
MPNGSLDSHLFGKRTPLSWSVPLVCYIYMKNGRGTQAANNWASRYIQLFSSGIYVSTGRASKESDVYGFGIVVIEITTGKKATEVIKEKDEEKGMIEWVWDHYGRG